MAGMQLPEYLKGKAVDGDLEGPEAGENEKKKD